MYEKVLEINKRIRTFEVENVVKCDIKLPSSSKVFFLTVVAVRQGKDMPFCLIQKHGAKSKSYYIEKPFRGGYFSLKDQAFIIDSLNGA